MGRFRGFFGLRTARRGRKSYPYCCTRTVAACLFSAFVFGCTMYAAREFQSFGNPHCKWYSPVSTDVWPVGLVFIPSVRKLQNDHLQSGNLTTAYKWLLNLMSSIPYLTTARRQNLFHASLSVLLTQHIPWHAAAKTRFEDRAVGWSKCYHPNSVRAS